MRAAAAAEKVVTSLGPEAWVVAKVLWQLRSGSPTGAIGATYYEPFRPGDEVATDPRRRALACLERSVAPKEFVVDIPEDGRGLIMHSLAHRDRPEDPPWPL